MTHSADTQSHATGTGGAFAFVRNGYDRADLHRLTTAELERATVYGRNDETIGTVSSLKVGTDGVITAAVIDVGGFLGLGAHSVMLPFSQLTVLRKTNGSDMRIHLDTTKEMLKAMPHHAV
ncbi:MAG: PRC-barrel domain-containing protein [Pararhodobacter sp.]|nr:PRC-barrel domain-containing protein [Pararhodobacter sp.]